MKEQDCNGVKVNVLGSEYTIIDDMNLVDEHADGMCHPYSKRIRMLPEDNFLEADDTADERRAGYEQTLRHEILHAFFFESGDITAGDEKMIEWLSVQFPKILQAFQQAGCIHDET